MPGPAPSCLVVLFHYDGRVIGRKSQLTVLAFLLPNLLGFLAFVLIPIVLSIVMAFTNWSLNERIELEAVGLRNFGELLGARPLGASRPVVLWAYVASAAMVLVGAVGWVWSNVASWPGRRLGGAALAAVGAGAVVVSAVARPGAGLLVAGAAGLLGGLAVARWADEPWRRGRGVVPPLVLLIGAAGLAVLHDAAAAAYQPRDPRFWQYFYNALFLMLGMPFSIAGALGLALLLNERLPASGSRRVSGAALCAVGGAITGVLLYALGRTNLAVVAGALWAAAGLGLAWNVVAFRTICYLPRFTAGVALMILWKAMYNPEHGPINTALSGLLSWAGLDVDPPLWLSSVAWAKPALILMGFWIAVGGTTMLLYLAALSNIPRELIEAARIDGAGRRARFRHVIWPQLAPTTFFIVVISFIGGLQGGFEQARVMTGGGPAGSTTTLSYYIYNKAFQDLDLGYGAAISWVLFAIIFLVTALNWKSGRALEVDVT